MDIGILWANDEHLIPSIGVNQHQQNENEHYSRSGISAGTNGTVVIVVGILSAILVLIIVVSSATE